MNEGVVVSVSGDLDLVFDALDDLGRIDAPDPAVLLSDAKNLIREKWDWALPRGLLRKSYASSWLDIHGAINTSKILAGTR